MKCFARDAGVDCVEEGTITDPEARPVFTNPENPDGPTVFPVNCKRHHLQMMDQREKNEASWRRMRPA